MDEEKTEENKGKETETKPEETKKTENASEKNSEVGRTETTLSVLDEAKKTADRIEAANKKQEELIMAQEKLFVDQRLGGRAEAGMQAPEPKKETDAEYAQRVMRGEANPLKDDGFI